jgi:hypothetical protein
VAQTRQDELSRNAVGWNFDTNLGRAVCGEILMLTWGATLGRNFDVNIGGMHVRYAVQRGICIKTQHLL